MISALKRLSQFIRSFKCDDIPKYCILISNENTCLITTSNALPKLRYRTCGKWRKISKSPCELDLDQSIPNVEPVRAISTYYNMFKFQVDQSIIF